MAADRFPGVESALGIGDYISDAAGYSRKEQR